MATNKKDICVIGIGKFGYSIVQQLVELRKQVLAIDVDENQLVQAARITNTAIVDGADIEGLRSLGIDTFDTVIVGCSENIEIAAALMELGVKHIITKAKSPRHERVLRQIGVNVIVKPEVEAGVRTALIATNSNFIKYSELLQEIGDGFVIGSTIVNDVSWIGKPLKDLNFKKLQVNVVSIKNNTKVSIPSGETILRKNDLITIIGKISDITKAFAELNDDSATKVIDIENIREEGRRAIQNKNQKK